MWVFSNLEFWQPFNGLQRPQDPQNSQGLDGVDVLAFGSSARDKRHKNNRGKSLVLRSFTGTSVDAQ